MDNHLTENGLKILKDSEGLRLKAYKCPAGVVTIGYGHTKTAKMGQVIDEATADKLLRSDLKWAEEAVGKLVSVELTDNEYSALVSLVFNIGTGAFQKSTLLRLLNSGKKKEAAAQILKWDKAGGQTLKGLTVRRQKEHALFLSK